MILSRFLLNPHSPTGAADLSGPYRMHQTIERLLEGGQALWRQEGHAVLLQSWVAPDWSRLPADHLQALPAQRSFEVDQLPLDQVLRFRLRANATVRKRLEGKTRGKRLALLGQAERLDWLARQGAKHGFRPREVEILDAGALVFQKGDDGPEITLNSCLFEGLLEVTDRALFHGALRQGIGPGKAFGMGLLSLA